MKKALETTEKTLLNRSVSSRKLRAYSFSLTSLLLLSVMLPLTLMFFPVEVSGENAGPPYYFAPPYGGTETIRRVVGLAGGYPYANSTNGLLVAVAGAWLGVSHVTACQSVTFDLGPENIMVKVTARIRYFSIKYGFGDFDYEAVCEVWSKNGEWESSFSLAEEAALTALTWALDAAGFAEISSSTIKNIIEYLSKTLSWLDFFGGLYQDDVIEFYLVGSGEHTVNFGLEAIAAAFGTSLALAITAGWVTSIEVVEVSPEAVNGFWSFDGQYGDWSYSYDPNAIYPVDRYHLNFYDYSMNGHEGWGYYYNPNYGGKIHRVDGIVGDGAEFEGDSCYIKLDYPEEHLRLLGDEGTFMAWIKPYENRTQHIIWAGKNYPDPIGEEPVPEGDGWGNEEEMHLSLRKDGQVSACFSGRNFKIVRDSGAVRALPNRWTHVAVTWRNETNHFSFNLYVNGTCIGQAVRNQQLRIDLDLVYIGKPGQNKRYFNGTIDQVRIFGRALSESEIKQYFWMDGGDPTPPSKPTLNSLPPFSQKSVLVSWSPSEDDETGVSGYWVGCVKQTGSLDLDEYFSEGGNWTQDRIWTTRTDYLFENLDEGTYYFWVRAQNGAGKLSEWDTELTRIDLTPPSGSFNVVTETVDGEEYARGEIIGDKVILRFNLTANDYRSGVIGYQVAVGSPYSEYWSNIIYFDPNNRESYHSINVITECQIDLNELTTVVEGYPTHISGKDLYVRFIDYSGNPSPPLHDYVSGIDISPPSGRIEINEGNGVTTTQNVKLKLWVRDDVKVGWYRVRNWAWGAPDDWGSPDEGWIPWPSNGYFDSYYGAWVDFKEIPWTLEPQPGWQRIMVQLKDVVGRVSERYVVWINFAPPPPSGASVIINDYANCTTSPILNVTLHCENAVSWSMEHMVIQRVLESGSMITVYDEHNILNGAFPPNSHTANIQLNLADYIDAEDISVNYVYMRVAFADPYGRTAAASDTIWVDTITPEITSLEVEYSSPQYVQWGADPVWFGEDGHTNVRNITVIISVDDISWWMHPASENDLYYRFGFSRSPEQPEEWSNWIPGNPWSYSTPTRIQQMIPYGVEGELWLWVQCMDPAGNIGEPVSKRLVLDFTPPNGTIQINNGAILVSSSNIILNVSAGDNLTPESELKIRFCNDLGVNDIGSGSWLIWTYPWEDFSGQRSWQLLPGEGIRYIYVQFKDKANNISPVYGTIIIVDETPPSGSIRVEDGALLTNSPRITLHIDAQDNLCPSLQMRVWEENQPEPQDWEPYTPTKSWQLSNVGKNVINVRFRDSAGNISPKYSTIVFWDPLFEEETLPGLYGNLASADLDGDGLHDLLAVDLNPPHSLHVLLSRRRFFEEIEDYAFDPQSGRRMEIREVYRVIIADLNGDGLQDLITIPHFESPNPTIKILLNQGFHYSTELKSLEGIGEISTNRVEGFTLFQTIPIAGSFYDAEVADLDGDGDLDLLVNEGEKELLIYLYETPVGFSPGGSITLAASCLSFEIGDVDLNGLPDIVFLLQGEENLILQVFYNSGGGSFSGRVIEEMDKPAFDKVELYGLPILLYDVNGDDLPDIVIGVNSEVKAYLNRGYGEFMAEASATFTVEGAPRTIRFFDVDYDGRPDLLVQSQIEGLGNQLQIVFGGGRIQADGEPAVWDGERYGLTYGILGCRHPSLLAQNPALGDVDGDGITEIILGSFNRYQEYELDETSILILKTVTPPQPVISSPTHPDQDEWYSSRDLRLEWCIPYHPWRIVGYWYIIDQYCHSSFEGGEWNYIEEDHVSLFIPEGEWWFHIIAADERGMLSPIAYYRIRVDQTPPSGSIAYAQTHSETVTLQISAEDPLSGVKLMQLREEGEDWGEWQKFSNTYTWRLSDVGLRTIYVRFMDEAGNISPEYSGEILYDPLFENSPLNGSFSNVELADMDGDGFLDLLAVDLNPPNALHIFLNASEEASIMAVEPTEDPNVFNIVDVDGLRKIALGDLDGNGLPDLVAVTMGGAVQVYMNYGLDESEGAFGFLKSQEINGGVADDVVLAYIDDDYDLDMLISICGPKIRQLAIYLNENGEFTVYDAICVHSLGVAVADINDDGEADIVTAYSSCPNTVDLGVFYGLGNGLFTLQRVDSNITSYSSPEEKFPIVIYDVNLDGKLDIVVGTYPISTKDGPRAMLHPGVKAYINMGNGDFDYCTPMVDGVKGVTRSIHPADVDSDGVLDLLILTHFTHTGGNEGAVYIIFSGGQYPEMKGEAEIYDITYLSNASYSSTQGLVAGDIENDGHPDIIIGAFLGYVPPGEIGRPTALRLTCLTPNSLPNPPESLSSVIDGTNVILSWSPGTDGETPQETLTYNLRVGTTPGGSEVFYGSVGYHLEKALSGLPDDTYYWSIQVVDSGYARSNWAEEQSFRIGRPGPPPGPQQPEFPWRESSWIAYAPEAPEVTIYSPENATYLPMDVAAIIYSVTSLDSNFTVTILLDGNEYAEDIIEMLKHPGRHTLTVTATDSQGRSGSSSVTFTSTIDTSIYMVPVTAFSGLYGTDEWLSFPDLGVDVYVEGSAAVYVAAYSRNPGASLRGDIGVYFDIYLPDTSGLVSLEIRKYYSDGDVWDLNLREHTLKMYWWNGTAWVRCSDTGVNTDENYIWARISETTTPSLMDLTGTPFSAAARPMPVGGTIVPAEAPTPSTPFSALTILLIVAVGVAAIAAKRRRRQPK